ncbi:translation factor SUI1 [Paecilomyces variotii]|uniref:Translation factor SUI1 n=1 Tax=Byssochlamys spectabilis TaxID=264951 RepID=A0A443I433_BYSSP|nr:translation factor SUI1 [Paecilomyces variotii]RWQ98859.1 translation factor SUI1 [Paecilomyces variotii]
MGNEDFLSPIVRSLPAYTSQNAVDGSWSTCSSMKLQAAQSYRVALPFVDDDPFAEADEDTGETKQSQNYIHIRIQQRNGRKTLTTVQGLPKKFDQKKILKVIKKKFACNGTIVNDTEMGEVIQLQGDQRKDVQEFLTDKKEGLELDAKTIKVHGF